MPNKSANDNNRSEYDPELPECPRRTIAVIGVGNPLIAEDSIGPRVLNRLQGRYGAEIALFHAHTTPLALFDFIDGQDLMIVVDAAAGGKGAGNILIHEMNQMTETPPAIALHHIGPMETLRAARYLYPEKIPHRLLFVLVETDAMNRLQANVACDAVTAIIDRAVKCATDADATWFE